MKMAIRDTATQAASANLPKIELFEPMRYVGRWYEVASLKKGFAGEGQQDCHCTQGISHPVCFAFCPRILLGIYVPIKNAKDEIRLEVNTFCFHGGPKGRLSGIRGYRVSRPSLFVPKSCVFHVKVM